MPRTQVLLIHFSIPLLPHFCFFTWTFYVLDPEIRALLGIIPYLIPMVLSKWSESASEDIHEDIQKGSFSEAQPARDIRAGIGTQFWLSPQSCSPTWRQAISFSKKRQNQD